MSVRRHCDREGCGSSEAYEGTKAPDSQPEGPMWVFGDSKSAFISVRHPGVENGVFKGDQRVAFCSWACLHLYAAKRVYQS